MIAVLDLADLFHEPFLPTFALYGALHALCLRLALSSPHRPWGRSILFIGCASALNVAVLYAGIISLEALGRIPAALRLYLALSMCALFGAIAYGFAIRLFWFPTLRPRRIAQIALGCMASEILGMGIQNVTRPFGHWWLAAVWWGALSGGLWLTQRRADVLRPQAHAQ